MAVQLRNNISLEELVRSVEHHHEQYLRSLHNFHELLSIHKRELDGRTTIQGLATPPLRALTFSSDANSILLPRLRRDTPDTHERPSCYPSPKFLPLTPNLNQGPGGYVIPDEEIPFIPLLDQSSSHIPRHLAAAAADDGSTAIPPPPHVRQVLTPMSFSDDMLLRHLRESEFCDEFASLLHDKDEPLPSWDIDSPQAFHELAAVERERFVSSTFEVYEVGEDERAVKTNLDVDVQGCFAKFAGDEALEPADDIIDAPIVWEAIKDVNLSGKAIGRITYASIPSAYICVY